MGVADGLWLMGCACAGLVSCQGSNAACSLALKPDGVVASRRHSPRYDSSSRLASGLDGGAIKRHFSPDTTLAFVPEAAITPTQKYRGSLAQATLRCVSLSSRKAFWAWVV